MAWHNLGCAHPGMVWSPAFRRQGTRKHVGCEIVQYAAGKCGCPAG